MRTTAEYLDAIKDKLGLRSDNATSKVLGVDRATVGRYRKGVCAFDDDVCFAVAIVLDINPFEVLIAAHIERAKDAETRAKWLRYWNDFSARFTVTRVSCGGMQAAAQPGQNGRRSPSHLMSDQPSMECEPALIAAIELLQQVRGTLSSSSLSQQERAPQLSNDTK